MAAAEFLCRNEALIRRRYRQRLGRVIRRLVDSQELLSTISRRFDAAVRDQSVLALDERQLFSLVFKIGDFALADKGRIMARLERVEAPDSPFAYELRTRFARAERAQLGGMELELDATLRQLSAPTDRQILTQWLMGHSHATIAREVEMTPEGVRKCWERIKARIRSHMVEPAHETDPTEDRPF